MSESSSNNSKPCESIRELISWYPGQTLEENERQLVDEHVVQCSACADMLQFVSTFREQLISQHASHPDAELLVRFVEDRSAIDPRQRDHIEGHIAACTECREQAAMLETIDRYTAAEDARERSTLYEAESPAAPAHGLRDFWNALRKSFLRPVPAAVYLVVAIVAVGLLLGRPGWLPYGQEQRQIREIGVTSDPGSAPGTIGGIVILADEMGRVRQAGSDESTETPIDAGGAQFLLLEFTGLEAPPEDEDLYTVSLVREGSTEPVFETTVRGKIFSETYTLCLSLEAGALTPGSYSVTVADPGGKIVYRSSIDAR